MPESAVGIIGLGVMGSAMSANLVKAGFSVIRHDMVAARRKTLASAGGRPARSSQEVGKRAPIIVTSLPSAEALAAVSAELAAVGRAGQIVIETSTLPLEVKQAARERMKAHGLGAMLLMYDENVRYVTSTLTPGWNRLKPGLRYALLCGDDAPVLFEQGDIGIHIRCRIGGYSACIGSAFLPHPPQRRHCR